MAPFLEHIKKTFKGDERFMMLQAYNRQMGYKQTDILKSSLSLLLEIPFFIAAFQIMVPIIAAFFFHRAGNIPFIIRHKLERF